MSPAGTNWPHCTDKALELKTYKQPCAACHVYSRDHSPLGPFMFWEIAAPSLQGCGLRACKSEADVSVFVRRLSTVTNHGVSSVRHAGASCCDTVVPPETHVDGVGLELSSVAFGAPSRKHAFSGKSISKNSGFQIRFWMRTHSSLSSTAADYCAANAVKAAPASAERADNSL